MFALYQKRSVELTLFRYEVLVYPWKKQASPRRTCV